MLREEVTETDIADIISQWTGIPVTKLVASERDKLLHLDEELHRRVIGQDEAVNAVADAIQRCAPDQAAIWTQQRDLIFGVIRWCLRCGSVYRQYIMLVSRDQHGLQTGCSSKHVDLEQCKCNSVSSAAASLALLCIPK